MATTHDILTTPQSGYNYIDALLAAGPDWNFLTADGVNYRTTLYYSFDTSGSQYEKQGLQGFNVAQQQAALDILAYVTQTTGIRFESATSSGAADLHFAVADVVNPELGGVCYAAYSYTGTLTGQLSSYSADAYIYLDSQQATNQAPVVGSWGYQALLHEIGHALGLKHPFEATQDATVTLTAPYQDTTAYSVMSYTLAGDSYYSQFNEYDLAALQFLYGTDGLGGSWGVGTGGLYLTGSSFDSVLTLPSGQVTLTDSGGTDLVRYEGAQEEYTLVPTRDKLWLHVSGNTTDHLISSSVEYLSFGDGTTVETEALFYPKGWVILGSSAADMLTGTLAGDLLFGAAGNDVFSGGGGNDLFAGDEGLDTVLINEYVADGLISRTDGVWSLRDSYGETSNFSSIERLQFLDGNVALDVDPNESAGMAALLATAAKGLAAVADRDFMGEIIALFDSGNDLYQTSELIVGTDWFKAATGGTDTGFINLVYEHVMGVIPAAAEQDVFLGLLTGQGGSMDQADLFVAAALSQANQDTVNLVGLQQTGLAYI